MSVPGTPDNFTPLSSPPTTPSFGSVLSPSRKLLTTTGSSDSPLFPNPQLHEQTVVEEDEAEPISPLSTPLSPLSPTQPASPLYARGLSMARSHSDVALNGITVDVSAPARPPAATLRRVASLSELSVPGGWHHNGGETCHMSSWEWLQGKDRNEQVMHWLVRDTLPLLRFSDSLCALFDNIIAQRPAQLGKSNDNMAALLISIEPFASPATRSPPRNSHR